MHVTLEELAACQQHEECMARWRDRVVVIEKVYLGKGVRHGHVRAKVIDDCAIRYVDYVELEPF